MDSFENSFSGVTKVTIVGIGMGNPETITLQAARVISQSNLLIGARRMLDSFPEYTGSTFCSISIKEIAEKIRECPPNLKVVVVVSGDVGFFSIAKGLSNELISIPIKRICGISSLQYFCAKLEMSWDDVRVVSLHGREEKLPPQVNRYSKTFVLTGGDHSVKSVCQKLTDYGLGDVSVWVGQMLSYPEETITHSTAYQLSMQDFAPLSVMMIINLNPVRSEFVTSGLEDTAFIRSNNHHNHENIIPMTKSEVRTVSISKLRLKENHIVYDIGAGTGSVSAEIALHAWMGKVYAIEKNPSAQLLLEENRQRFSLKNLEIVCGEAPQAIENLPPPDRVFIGGSTGHLEEIIKILINKNPTVRVVINAITLETTAEALRCFSALEFRDIQVVQIMVACAKEVGQAPYHMMLGQNPVMILSAEGSIAF